jgi:hypothetical protein
VKLGSALGRIGASVVKEVKAGENRTTLLLRVAEDKGDQWVETFTELMLQSAVKKGPWTVDVSKHFFTQNGAVRYFWRIIISGKVQEAYELLGRIALEVSMRHTKEIVSFPLVGRAEYVRDPARGLLKGAHSRSEGIPMDVAAHFVAR